MKISILSFLLVTMGLIFHSDQAVGAQDLMSVIGQETTKEIVTGVDKETKSDKVLLSGTIVDLNNRVLNLSNVQPFCRRSNAFKIRNFDTSVQLTKGKTIWFWMIGNCSEKDSVIDIIIKPRGL